jgi:hypothetical protein
MISLRHITVVGFIALAGTPQAASAGGMSDDFAPAKTVIAGVEAAPFIKTGVTTSAAVDTLKAEVAAARRLDAAEIAMGSGRVAVLGAKQGRQ